MGAVMLQLVSNALKDAGFRLFRVGVDTREVTVTLASSDALDRNRAKKIVTGIAGHQVSVKIY